MKKTMMRLTALVLSFGMMAGCGKNMETEDVTAERLYDGDNIQASASFSAEKLKLNYAGSETVEYAEPMYNLPKDYQFVYENLPDAFMEQEEYDCFQIFYDSSLQEEKFVDIKIEKNYDDNSLTISPGRVFCYEETEESLEENTWGSRSKFYLVQYKDLETGEDLEKPLVTVFTIANELNAPTVTQGIAENGYYKLSWNEVEEADYYEVYYYNDGMDYAELELTIEGTSCDYSEFKTCIDHAQRWEEVYGETEVADADGWSMNEMLQSSNQYFVVAKSNDGRHSGMSNFCNVNDIANQIPYMISDDFQREYEGDSALALPAYADVTMVDESVGSFLIEYHGASVTLLEDGRIAVEAGFKNLPIYMYHMYLTGVDYDTFMAESQELAARSDELATKSVTATEEINIPYLPEKETEAEPESDVELENEPESELESESESQAVVSGELSDTVFATSALSEWIALNMLEHEERISLDGFNEASDSEILLDAALEAYHQNPLIGVLDTLDYDYASNELIVNYSLSAEDTEYMQTESIKKAAEIASEIITEGMSEYEKEEAINRYLCENASYNEEIMNYINGDGTISEDAVSDFVNSFTPYGILCENLGVCESYAEAFLLIAREAGLEAIIVTGRMDNVNHEWNRVKIDGFWYSLDVTNNDRDILPNSYFNLPDEMSASILMESGDAMLDTSLMTYTAEGMDNEYYVKEGRYTEDTDEAAQLLAAGLSENPISTIRINADASQQDVETIVNGAIAEANMNSGMYYYYEGVLSIATE